MSHSQRSASSTGLDVRIDGEDPADWYEAGMAALSAGRLDDARRWAKRCAAASATVSDARCAALVGRVALEDDDFDDAAAHLRRALELAPDDVAIARDLGEALA